MFGFITKALTQVAHCSHAVLIGGGLKMVGQYIIVDTVCNRIGSTIEEANQRKQLEKEQEQLAQVKEQIEAIQAIQHKLPDQVTIDQVKEQK